MDTNGHEWTLKIILNHEKHEIHEKYKNSGNAS